MADSTTTTAVASSSAAAAADVAPDDKGKKKGSSKRKADKPVKKEAGDESSAAVAVEITDEKKTKKSTKKEKKSTKKEKDEDEPKSKRAKKSKAKDEDGDDAAADEEKEGGEKKKKKPHRFRPGTVALRQIKNFQKTEKLLTQRAPLERQVRALAENYSADGFRFTAEAISALHEARDFYATHLLGMAYLGTLHAKRITLMDKDIRLALRMTGANADMKVDNVLLPNNVDAKAPLM
jgi:histone H3